MNEAAFQNKLEAHGLGKYFDKLQPFLKNSIRLYLEATDESTMAVGQTKIGGRPDLPPEVNWVTETSIVETTEMKLLFFNTKKQEEVTKPLSFIAQINLAETAPFDTEGLLPKTGLLYFFYSAEQEAWGFDYKDKDQFKVIYWDGDFSQLKRTAFPHDLPEYACYKPCSVTLQSAVSWPSYGHEVYNCFAEGDDDRFWDDVCNDGSINKLLGYSDNIQGDMQLECELVTNGLYCGDPSGYEDPRAKALEPNAKNWQLLLQIDTNDEHEMMWGDSGRIYFWIRKDDLLNKRFDKSWFCLQCG